ncbi:MAG: hypothetical protein HYU87_11735, partial [Chloroflexi bacterium]|nr:hypothetical protein [Chloroflexota bacterium]
MDTTTLVIVIAAVAVAAVAAGAFLVMRRRRARRAYRPMTSYSEDRTFVGIGATPPPVSDATMVGPMGRRPAAPRSGATVVDVRATVPPPPSAPPPPEAPAASSEAPTAVMGGRQAEEVIAPTIRIPKLRARLTVMK